MHNQREIPVDIIETILQGTRDGIVGTDQSGRIVLFNDGMESLTGVSRSEAIGSCPQELWKEASGEKSVDRDRCTACQIETRDGTSRAFTKTIYPHNKDDIVEVCVYHDITELIESQAREKEQESFFRDLVEEAKDLIIVLDFEGNITYTSPSVSYAFQEDQDRLTGRPLWTYFTHECSESFLNKFNHLKDLPNTVLETGPLKVHRQGTGPRWFTGTINNRHPHGVDYVYIVNLTDITRNYEAEKKLVEEHRLMKAIMSTSVAAVTTLDKSGNITYANEAAKHILGLDPSEVSKRSYNSPAWRHEALDGGEFPDEEMPYTRVMKTEAPVYDIRHSIVWPNGERKSLSINGAPLFDSEGDLNGAVFSVLDITAQLDYQSELKVFKNAFDASGSGILISDATDKHLKTIYANESIQSIFQGTVTVGARNPLLNRTNRLLSSVESAIAENKTVRVLKDLETSQGQVTWLEIYIVPIRSNSSRIDRVVFLCNDVTDRQNAVLAMQESQTVLSLLFYSVPVALTISDEKGQIQLVNEQFSQLIGRNISTIENEKWWEAFPEGIKKKLRSTYESFLSGQLSHHKETIVINRPSSSHSLSISLRKLLPFGEKPKVLSLVEDLSSRKREELLKTQLTNLGEKLNSTITPVEAARVVVEFADELIGWDASYVAIFDDESEEIRFIYAADEINGQRTIIGDLSGVTFPSEKYKNLVKDGGKLIDETTKPQTKNLGFFGDESRNSESMLFVPLKSRRGQNIGVLSIQSYTKEFYSKESLKTLELLADYGVAALARASAQEELKLSETRYRAFANAIPDLLFRQHRDGTFLDCNQISGDRLALPASEFLGKKISDLPLPPEVIRQNQEHVAKALETNSICSFEYELDVPAGTRRFEARVAPSSPDEVVMICRDITERVEAEEERQKLEAQIQHGQKLESLGILAGGIAHDFNNLLSGVLGNAGLALMDLPSDSPVKPPIKQIETTALRMADLTRQMLAYSGKGKFEVEKFDLNQVVQEMSELLRVSINKKAHFQLELSTQGVQVDGDVTQLRQIVMNLITNASDALEDTGGEIILRTDVKVLSKDEIADVPWKEDIAPGTFAVISVKDTGIGMTEETRKRIFDPFFSTKFTGRGLGLAAVQGIVRSHRGFMRIESELNVGTHFEIFLPSAKGKDQRTSSGTAPMIAFRGEGSILVVDDETTVRTVIRNSLERLGFKIVEASDGIEALEIFREQQDEFRFILLDITMPGMDGIETLKHIRDLNSEIPVLLMSGYSHHEAMKGSSGLKISGFLAKPFRARDLISNIFKLKGGGRL